MDRYDLTASGGPARRFEFTEDPRAFLDCAGSALAANPVVASVVAAMAERLARSEEPRKTTDVPQWFVCLLDDDDMVVGAAMRTAQFPPYPMFVLPMPDAGAAELAEVLHARGEHIEGVNGALPAARIIADEIARLDGKRVRIAMHTRLFELTALNPPRPVPGTLRLASHEDSELVATWLGAFAADADRQAGRPPGSTPKVVTPEYVERRISASSLYFWVIDDRPVTLIGATPPAYAVSRVGPVYTPPDLRGRGYASAAVAEVSADLLAQGIQPCLYTDQANPTSNRIYQALGYVPVVDQAHLLIEPG